MQQTAFHQEAVSSSSSPASASAYASALLRAEPDSDDAPIFSLPNEILAYIVSHFLLQDLESLAASCSLFRTVCASCLHEHRALYRKYRHLASNETERLGWLAPLLELLRGEFPVEYVEKISFSRCEYLYSDLNVNKAQKLSNVVPSDEELSLVKQAVKDSPWITDHDACGPRANARDGAHFVEEVIEGDQDNILAILVPLLPNLRGIYLPPNDRCDLTLPDDTALAFGSLPQVLNRIAVASDRAGGIPAALPKLTEIRGSSVKCALYDDWLPYLLSIPTLRILELSLEYGWADFSYWPPEFPKSNVEELIIHGEPCDWTLLDLLAKTIKGPCKVQHDPDQRLLLEQDAFATKWRSCIIRDGQVTDLVLMEGTRTRRRNPDDGDATYVDVTV